MRASHLTDNEIQQYITDRSGCEGKIIEHVQLCDECKEKAATYQLLFTGISQQQEPVFDFNLSELVLAQLPRSQPKFLPDNFFVYLLISIVILLAGTLSYIFREYLLSLFAGFAPVFIYLIITTAIIVLGVLATDMYKNYQKKMNRLDFQ